MSRLTAKNVERAKPGRHADGDGLFLVVGEKSAKSWLLRVQVDKVRRDIGIGSASVLTLAEARERARKLRAAAKRGEDPIALRDYRPVDIPTFAKAVEMFHEQKSKGWATRHADAFLSTLKLHAYPKLGKLRVDSVTADNVIAVLSPIWTDRPAAARKLRSRIKAVLDYAHERHWRVAPAPALTRSLSRQARPGNFSAMPYADVPAFVADLRSKPTTMSRLAVLFAILTGARSGEVRSAQWSHINFDKRLWTRPASLMKGGIEHQGRYR